MRNKNTSLEQSNKILYRENQLSQTDKTQVGIYWGTFDPVTLAHLNIALTALQKFNLSKLIIVVNDNTNTGKQYQSYGKSRVKMWKLMLDDIKLPHSWKNRIKIIRQTDKKAFSYEAAKKAFLGRKIHGIVGQDSFDKFKSYKAALAAYDHTIVAPRGSEKNLLQNEIVKLGLPNVSALSASNEYLDVSSTRAREILAKKVREHELPKLLHSAVIYAIHKYGFFKPIKTKHNDTVTNTMNSAR